MSHRDQQDDARLDFLEQEQCVVDIPYRNIWRVWPFKLKDMRTDCYGSTLREAIDKAIDALAAEKGG